MNKRRKYNCNAAYFKNECVYLFFYEGKVRHQTGFFFNVGAISSSPQNGYFKLYEDFIFFERVQKYILQP